MLSKIVQSIKSISLYIGIIACLTTATMHTTTRPISSGNAKEHELCFCDFCQEIGKVNTIKTCKAYSVKTHAHEKKIKNKNNKRTIMIYMAADNDLRPFAARNIQQMADIGSNNYITIVVHLDIRITGNKKITRRYLIEKDEVFHIDPYNPLTQQMDSGNPATLISFCEWAIKNYIAEEYDLILWNHGTGILEPPHGKIINPMDLFVFNPATHRLELDRSVGFMEAIDQWEPTQRGVCWDDTTGNYLSNRKLETALDTICQKCLQGKKFGIIGFDACLMSMIEVVSFIKRYAHIMVGSQEVELGMGWKYDEVLLPFTKTPLNTCDFASHIVNAYEKTYQSITNDYTLSAINLNSVDLLEKNIDQISKLLIENTTAQKSNIYQIIRESKNKMLCTHFDEPTYIDLHHFYKNLLVNLKKSENIIHKNTLLTKLEEGINLIEQLVIANTVGKNLKNAHGIAIYFPERVIHSSYNEAIFLKSNSWGTLLSKYTTV